MDRTIIIGALALLVGSLWQGCNSQSNPGPASSSAAAGATAGVASLAAPQGPYPRGTVNPAHLPAQAGPALVFTSPTRGAQLSPGTISCSLTATDPDGVAEVRVLGRPATAAGQGFSAQVALAPGVNTITAEATDRLGNRSTAYVSVSAGRFVDDTQVLERSLALGMTPAGLRRVCDVAEQLAANLQLFPLIDRRNPIVDTASVKVRVDAVRHLPLKFEAAGAASGLQITVHIDRPALDASATLAGFPLARAVLGAARATAVIDATVDKALAAAARSVPAKRSLGLRIDRIQVSFDRFEVSSPSAIVDPLLRSFRGTVESALRGKLEEVLATCVSDVFGTSLLGIDRPLTIDLPPVAGAPAAQVQARFEVDQGAGAAGAGLGIQAGGACSALVGSRALPGKVLVTGTAATAKLGPEPFCLTLGADALNGLLHGVWRAGGLSLNIDGTVVAPGATMRPKVQLLYPFLPPVRDLAPDPETPISLLVTLEAAPVVVLGGAAAPYVVQAGEAQLRLVIDYMDGQPALTLFTLRAALTIEADLALDATSLRCTKLAPTNVRVDVIEEPVCDLADQELEDFIHAALPWILDRYELTLPRMPIPALPFGLQLQAPRVEVTPDVLTVRAGL